MANTPGILMSSSDDLGVRISQKMLSAHAGRDADAASEQKS
jgi:hypothetical protein